MPPVRLHLLSIDPRMIIIKPVTQDHAGHLKAIRLRALKDTPLAFGSTYAKESAFTDADWQNRITTWTRPRAIGYLAMDGENPCGLCACFIEQDDVTQAHLVSMWVAPTYRRQKIGEQLVTTALNWATAANTKTITLNVTSTNESAIRFYEKLGFTKTGNIGPYPNDPALFEYEMARKL
jgi:ribosomal protein S18 acetylase RimI-like enzyme